MIRLSFAIASAAVLTTLAVGVPYAMGQLDAAYSTTSAPVNHAAATPLPTHTPLSTPVPTAASVSRPVMVDKYKYAAHVDTSQYITPYHVTQPTFTPPPVYQSSPPPVIWQPTPTPVCHTMLNC